MPKAEHVSDHQKNLSVQDGQGNAEAIPELIRSWVGLSVVCPISPIAPFGWHPFSGATEATFVFP
jgi:hypothetical protein